MSNLNALQDDDLNSDTIEFKEYKLSDDFKKYSLEQCLQTINLKKILENFGEKQISDICEKFGVTDVNKLKEYEHIPNQFFFELLWDLAIKSHDSNNIENKSNINNLNNLIDLQAKLWQLNIGKLTCKLIKKSENVILEELNDPNKNKMILGVNFYHYQDKKTAVRNNEAIVTIDPQILCSKLNYSKQDAIKSSSSTSSVITDSSGESQPRTHRYKKPKVGLFYHENQDMNRINHFKSNFNSIIDFDDLTVKKEIDLEYDLERNNFIFILYDKTTDDLLDTCISYDKQTNYCKCKKECKCDFYKKFYELIYKMYLDRKNSKYCTFLMDDFNKFKNEKQTFKYKWLLREKKIERDIFSEKKVYLKPYQLPESNNDFDQKLTDFIYSIA